MKKLDVQQFLLSGALEYLNQITPVHSKFYGPCYLSAIDGAAYVVRFKYTDKWEIDTCVKWMR
ncbi:hypothetical protein DYBT9623_00672 [Dyadobacter sp. CECT 9623]|uniref:Uncharacterized protein n=1 Tax=Dyadobacter linearis TaxID=2823330 RepID=A0ABN7R3M2_9BACT|nr:hypothetical protein DYBT9623_00672 [Dyadobacter sp. CECT 9623]